MRDGARRARRQRARARPRRARSLSGRSRADPPPPAASDDASRRVRRSSGQARRRSKPRVGSSSRSTTASSRSRARPGTGKTYTGARMALELVAERRGGRGHGAVAPRDRQLPRSRRRGRLRSGRPASGSRQRATTRRRIEPRRHRAHRLERRALGRAGGWGVRRRSAGTSWLWARPDMAGAASVLFVDEAGQLSLATVCSIGGAANSFVLLGDPQQLPR